MPEIKCSYKELVPIHKLQPHPKNPHVHTPEQIDRLAKLIDYQGIRHPVIVSKRSGFIVAGHGRLASLKKLNAAEVPIDYQDFESEAQEYAFIVSDNSIGKDEWAALNMDEIKSYVADFADFDLDLLAIKDFEIEPPPEPGCDEDAVPAAPVEPVSKLGDLYEIGNHRLLCGDSTSSEAVSKLFGEHRASLWLSDPPYGINHVEVSGEKGQSKGYKKIENDDLKDEQFKEFIFKTIEASKPFMKKHFAFYMWHAMKMQGYTAAAAAAGILFHRQIVWVKPNFVFGRGHYHWRHELCLMGWLKGDEPEFHGERNQSSVWEIKRDLSKDLEHPTQKPIEIWEPAILNHSLPGDLVYEPFSGSGSNMIACEKHSRKCFAMELEPSYVDQAISRWCQYTGQTKVKRNGQDITWEVPGA